MIYLSGTFSALPEKWRPQFGYMLNVMRAIGQERSAVAYPWMLDNGAFSKKWDERIWLDRLHALRPHLGTCIGAVVPDVILDARATVDRWYIYSGAVRSAGYKPFFATQNGCTVAMVPWDEIGGLFIGGSNEHRQNECWPLIREAKRRGVHVHVGRVNSRKSIMRYCAADSVDGTNFMFGDHRSDQSINHILETVKLCNQQQYGQLSMLDWLRPPTP